MTTRVHARPHGRLASRAGLWAVAGAALLVVPLALAGCTSSTPHVEDTYGGLPSYLPTAPAGTDTILTGTLAKPALTSEGDAVKVKLPGGGSVVMTVTGPVVPGEGLPYQADVTTCTWTITLSGATRAIPIVLADMTTLDQLGTIYPLSPVPHEAAPPTSITPGRTTTFEVRTGMKVGEGLLRWAPGSSAGTSHGIIAEWDFEVEND